MKGNTYGTNESESIRKYLQVFSASFFKKRVQTAQIVRTVVGS